ncbi:hypothetical protein BH18PSE1_BH18PSE1_12010 [soil metagenome]
MRVVGDEVWRRDAGFRPFPLETVHEHAADAFSLRAASLFALGLDLDCCFFRKMLLMGVPALHDHLGRECPKKYAQSDL